MKLGLCSINDLLIEVRSDHIKMLSAQYLFQIYSKSNKCVLHFVEAKSNAVRSFETKQGTFTSKIHLKLEIETPVI
jgi:hypothetical protein